MPPDSPAFTEAELADIERWAHETSRQPRPAGERPPALRLVEEVRWYRTLYRQHLPRDPGRAGHRGAPGRAGARGRPAIKAGKPDIH